MPSRSTTSVLAAATAGLMMLLQGPVPGGGWQMGLPQAEGLFLPRVRLPRLRVPRIKLPRINKDALLKAAAILSGAGKLGAAAKALGKVGSGLAKGVKGVGKAVAKGVKGISKKLQEALGKKGGGGIGGKIRAQIQKVLNPLAQRLSKAARPILQQLFQMAIQRVAPQVTATFEELLGAIRQGQVIVSQLEKIVVDKIAALVRPFLEEKVALAVNKVISAIRPGLDAAVKVAVGTLGSIPFAGGIIATAVVTAYGWGMDQLPKLGAQLLVQQAEASLLRPLLSSGAVLRLPPVRAILNYLKKSADKLASLVNKAERLEKLLGPREARGAPGR